jgi:hypothetical protein
VLDTIEIQSVRVLSGQVFAHLQAPYRAELAARAEQARVEAERATRALKARMEAEATEVEAREAARRAEMTATTTRRTAELERDRVLHEIAIAEEERRAQAAAEVNALDAERAAALVELGHKRTLDRERQDAELELRKNLADVDHELRRRDAEARERDHAIDAAHQRRLAEIEQLLARDRALRELVTIGLPQIAKGLRAEYRGNYTQIGGGADPLPAAIAQLVALARGLGLPVPEASPDHSGA